MSAKAFLLLGAAAGICTGITSGAKAQQTIKGEATHTHLLPTPQKVSYLPPQHSFAPANLIASLTQAALAVETITNGQTPDTKTITDRHKQANGANKAAAVVPRFFANRITYRPSSQAANSFLHEHALQQDSRRSEHTLYQEQQSHKLTDPLSADENAQINREIQLQEHKNALNVQITAAFMQIIQALGQEESKEKQELLKQGQDRLTELCGAGQCQWSMTRLQSWIEHNAPRIEAMQSPVAVRSAIELVEAENQLARQAIATDCEIANIRASLGINNTTPTPGEKALATLSFVPSLYTSLASLAQAGVERGTGGSRPQRLAHVLAQGELLTNRVSFLTRQANLVVQQNNIARQTNNRLMLVFTSDYADYLSGR